MKRIGVLTGGGDCPGLNAVLRAVGKTVIPAGIELVGFEDGFLGLLLGHQRVLHASDLSGILTLGGTIIGTSNRDNPFMWRPPGSSEEPADYSDLAVQVLKTHNVEGLVCIGGEGTLGVAERLMREKGIPCVGVPKTIDNDLNATDVTFGFNTAVQIATEAIDRLHSTAMSHHRAMVVEVMGRYAGWLALYSGVAGGGDIILLPEIPYKLEAVYEKLHERNKSGKRFSILVVSEGARTAEGKLLGSTVNDPSQPLRLGGVGAYLAAKIEGDTGLDARVTVLGHLQRGGTPTAADRILATQFGHLAGEMVVNGDWGKMAACRKGCFEGVPLVEAVAELKTVPLDDPLIAAARDVGTSFGDEMQ